MAESKYGKYIFRQTKPHPKISAATPAALEGLKDWGGIEHRMVWNHVSQPVLMYKDPHVHEFDEFLCFLSSDPRTPFDLGAQIELSLGKEGERQIINAATIVCVPKGMVHGPLNFKKVDRTVLFCRVDLGHENSKDTAP
jgi:hypothetical protein